MVVSNYGNFNKFCYYSTLPVCNLYDNVPKYCALRGFNATTGHEIGNLGLVLVSFLGVVLSILFIVYAQRRWGAVGRKEMQVLYFSYIVSSISAIFANGGFIFNRTILIYFSAIEIASTVSTAWLLLINAIVAYQLLPDGGILSMLLTLCSSIAMFIGTGYIALDSAFNWTSTFNSATDQPELLRNYALYTLYLLFPLVAIVFFMVLQLNLVIRVLHERKPLFILSSAFIMFVVSQIFEFVVSKYICNDTTGKIDGSLLACLCILISFGFLWAYWQSITEDEWVAQATPWEPEMREFSARKPAVASGSQSLRDSIPPSAHDSVPSLPNSGPTSVYTSTHSVIGSMPMSVHHTLPSKRSFRNSPGMFSPTHSSVHGSAV
ncbi:chitin synthase III catalytic subunit-domain-containing protein [Dipodascopsis uninucleata]